MGKEKTAVVPAAEAEELPKTIVKRVVKDKLSQISIDGGDVTLHREALLAFSESARIFIHYLSATAHDVCNEAKRQIINADDVMKALEEIEFSDFIEQLKAPLDEFRKKAAGKRAGSSKAKEANKKRKPDGETATENGKEDKVDNEANNDEDEIEDGKDGDEVDNEANDDEDETENGKDEDEVDNEAIDDDDDDAENGKDEDEVGNEANDQDETENEEQTSEDKDDSHDS